VDRPDLLAAVTADLALIGEALDDPARLVPACPGWDAGRLATHLLGVHRMVTHAVTTGAPPPAGERPAWPRGAAALRAELAGSGAALVALLAAADLDRPVWSFIPGQDTVAFWCRRMTHEHAVHRVDAQQAAGLPVVPVPTPVAVDGIDEWLMIANERTLPRRATPLVLGGSVHLHATDAVGEWTIRSVGGRLVSTPGHGKGDAAVRGPASTLMLGLWARADLLGPDVERFGDPAVVAALAGVGGN
jgi:uncharacterized protein (TIGR03083 family)